MINSNEFGKGWTKLLNSIALIEPYGKVLRLEKLNGVLKIRYNTHTDLDDYTAETVHRTIGLIESTSEITCEITGGFGRLSINDKNEYRVLCDLWREELNFKPIGKINYESY